MLGSGFQKSVIVSLMGGASLLLPACSTPYALNVQKVDLSQPQAQGSIMVSDVKLYRREALIKERNDEVAWLNELIKSSETVEFQPELLREIEVIRSFSAGLGLSFDPAAGFNYRQGRALSAAQQQVALDRLAQGEELAAIKQEIALERLRFQLEQLKADLALARAKMADQTEAVNADLGKLGDVAGPAAAGAVSTPTSGATAAAGTAELFTRLTTRLRTH